MFRNLQFTHKIYFFRFGTEHSNFCCFFFLCCVSWLLSSASCHFNFHLNFLLSFFFLFHSPFVQCFSPVMCRRRYSWCGRIDGGGKNDSTHIHIIVSTHTIVNPHISSTSAFELMTKHDQPINDGFGDAFIFSMCAAHSNTIQMENGRNGKKNNNFFFFCLNIHYSFIWSIHTYARMLYKYKRPLTFFPSTNTNHSFSQFGHAHLLTVLSDEPPAGKNVYSVETVTGKRRSFFRQGFYFEEKVEKWYYFWQRNCVKWFDTGFCFLFLFFVCCSSHFEWIDNENRIHFTFGHFSLNNLWWWSIHSDGIVSRN